MLSDCRNLRAKYADVGIANPMAIQKANFTIGDQLSICSFISDSFGNILIPKCRLIVAKVTKAILRGCSADMTSLLGTFSVYLWYLNHMNILITIFPFRDVSTSNGSPFIHMNGSHPIGDFS